ncbi:MAG: hypothetical protein ACI4CS_00950 [Candidatus Weimeria sp.]
MNGRGSNKKTGFFSVKSVCIALAVIFAVGGIISLVLAPEKSESPDETNLKNELKRNAAMLNKRAHESASGNAVSTVSSGKTAVVTKSSGENEDEKKEKIESFTAIGDSVMLGASPEILKLYPDSVVDAKESRQVRQAPEIINSLKKKGQLKDTVIIALGLNGPFSKEVGQNVLDTIGSDHKIFWVLPYGNSVTYVNDVIDTIKSLADSNTNLRILDWPAAAKGHPEWFYHDGIHLKPSGQKGYAKWLKRELDK